MTREIKFRAWDEELNAMFHLHKTGDYNGKFIWKEYGDRRPTTIHTRGFDAGEFRSTFNIMQFTGLKDKNEKEIYEGDIVHCKTIDRENVNYKEVVSWHELGYWFPFGNGSMSEDSGICEVIGNIYENKDLLV